MAKKIKRSKKKRGGKKKVKRGCGKRNWRTGGNALWKCKKGKRRPYRTYTKKKK